ncbi:ABC transporter ATP-binding protein [Acinetobacter sp.]|uniref:ABC transporter ATP-binding protein n=1 Tax=Acinetobacter sp. TaxID=472 RepID=UPI0031D76BA2
MSLILDKVTKSYPTRRGDISILHDISFTLNKGERLGILGKNGAGKSTLIKVLGGVENPSSGYIDRGMSISWPLAFTGGFQSTLSGLDNTKFICRVYGVDYKTVIDQINDFSELGYHLYEPIRTYSSGMLARLAFAVSMSINFDCYLIDEVISVGDARFRDKCRYELLEKRKDSSLILVTHDMNILHEYCNRYCYLDSGYLTEFSSYDEAKDFYERN